MDIHQDKADQQKNSLHAPILTAVRWALSRKFFGETIRVHYFNVREGIFQKARSGVTPSAKTFAMLMSFLPS
jgi:hypothetical protein